MRTIANRIPNASTYGRRPAPATSLKEQVLAAKPSELTRSIWPRPSTQEMQARGLTPVVLQDQRTVEREKQTAWIDEGARTFYVQSEGFNWLDGEFENVFGPFPLDR